MSTRTRSPRPSHPRSQAADFLGHHDPQLTARHLGPPPAPPEPCVGEILLASVLGADFCIEESYRNGVLVSASADITLYCCLDDKQKITRLLGLLQSSGVEVNFVAEGGAQ